MPLFDTRSVMMAAVAVMLLPGAAAAQAAPVPADALKREGFAIVDAGADRIGRINDAIYSYAEIGFQEYKTVDLLTRTLADAGFKVDKGVARIPTAFVATYGSGGPVIGLMADFDGVPGTSQKPLALAHEPLVPGAPGHGEGHNTGQPTLLAAALAIKALKDRHALPGTIVIYGGPAEELLASRGYMVNAGLYKGVDAVIDVHIGTELATSWGLQNLGILSAQWTFTGTQAHGARAWEGRSALDAVEVMNISTDFMREHIAPSARMHSVIPDGGQQPNVVPGEATTWYYFRETSAQKVWDLFKRARQAAKGAALATSTTVTERILSASWPFNGNKELAELVQANIERAGMPAWSAADQAFARAYQTSMGVPVVGMPTKVTALRKAGQASGSTDAGDVSWQAPFVRLRIPAKPDGELAGHHWSAGIAPATPLAHKGITAGAKVLVGSAIDLMTDPALLARMKAGFAAQLAAFPGWKSMIPPDADPPTFLNVDEMARYRAALKPFEYDPKSGQTYLQFLKVAYPPAQPATAIGLASNDPNAGGE